MYSKPYEPEDQYEDLKDIFLKGKFDVAFQSFDNAFPMKASWKRAIYDTKFG